MYVCVLRVQLEHVIFRPANCYQDTSSCAHTQTSMHTHVYMYGFTVSECIYIYHLHLHVYIRVASNTLSMLTHNTYLHTHTHHTYLHTHWHICTHLHTSHICTHPLTHSPEDIPQGQDSRYLFQLSSNRGTVRLGCRDKQEREGWMQWMTRASGQKSTSKLELLGGESRELDKHAAIKDIVSIDVTELDHNKLFAKMFARTLEVQLKDESFNRVRERERECVCVCIFMCVHVCIYMVLL